MAETEATRKTRRRREFAAPPEPGDDAILTSREARRLLKIGKTKLHEMTRLQMIPAYRIGSGKTSGLRYCRKDLLEWLYRQRVGG